MRDKQFKEPKSKKIMIPMNDIATSSYCKPLYTQEERKAVEKAAYLEWKESNLMLVNAIEVSIAEALKHFLAAPSWETRRPLGSLMDTLNNLAELHIENRVSEFLAKKEEERNN